METPEWKLISSTAKDLVHIMLSSNPINRPTIAEVLEHPWMRVSTVNLENNFHQRPFSFTLISEQEELIDLFLCSPYGLIDKFKLVIEKLFDSNVCIQRFNLYSITIII